MVEDYYRAIIEILSQHGFERSSAARLVTKNGAIGSLAGP
jgi:hypothetical protein